MVLQKNPIDDIGFVGLVDRMVEDPALKVVNSARISYDKKKSEFDEKDAKLCGFLWEHGHSSPYRHSYFTFHIKAPLFVFRQWVKYQVGSGWRKYEVDGEAVSLEVFDMVFDTDKNCSWNEMSGRYVELPAEFYIPSTIRTNPSHGNKQAAVDLPKGFDHEYEIKAMVEDCHILYDKYLERLQRGVAKEMARMFLPQNIYTQAYWTVSLQGLMHMLQQRMHKDAQWEIQQYARSIFDIIKSEVPTSTHLFANLDDIVSEVN